MWKVAVGFIVFALLALFVVMKGGDKLDMQGEAGHTSGADHASAPAAPAGTPAAPAPAAAPAASK